MKVKNVRLHYKVWDDLTSVHISDQDKNFVFIVYWGRFSGRTKAQAIAIAKRLCDRFNSGQEVKK